MKEVRLVIVGGHHTPALAVIDSLRRNFQIRWIGHKFSMWGDKNVSAEYQEVTRRGIPFNDLKAGKLYQTFHPLKLVRLPFGFLQAFYYLLKIRPDLIVSFGGYMAPPVVIAGWLLRIPAVTHEQTVEGGWANKLVARFAKIVFLTWEQSLEHFPKEKCIVVGNPIRNTIFAQTQKSKIKSQILSQNSKLGTIYITGGKQGSHVLNVVASRALPRLLEKYNVIHQCGRSSVHNDYETLNSQLSTLNSEQRSRYWLQDYFGEEEIGSVFAVSDVVISRAGANIVYELAALGKPAILIPIPWVSHDEQRKNAEVLVNAGSATVLEERDITPNSLTVRTDELFSNLEKYQEGGRRAQQLVRLDAAERISREVIELL